MICCIPLTGFTLDRIALQMQKKYFGVIRYVPISTHLILYFVISTQLITNSGGLQEKDFVTSGALCNGRSQNVRTSIWNIIWNLYCHFSFLQGNEDRRDHERKTHRQHWNSGRMRSRCRIGGHISGTVCCTHTHASVFAVILCEVGVIVLLVRSTRFGPVERFKLGECTTQ